MELSDLFAALDPRNGAPDARFAALEPLAAHAALALLTRMVGLPLVAIRLPAPSLAMRFAHDRIPPEAARVFGRNIGRYRAWRRLVLDAQMLATGEPVDPDTWDSLRRAGRLARGEACARALQPLKQYFSDVSPPALTFDRVLRVHETLSGSQRQCFRRAMAALGRLHDADLPLSSDRLPPRMPPLPRPLSGPQLPLPPQLARLADQAGPDAPNALRACWSVAVAAGLVSVEGDPAPARLFDAERWSRLSDLDPAAHGLRFSRRTFAAYRQRAAKLLVAAGSDDFRRDAATQAWSALTRAMRETGRHADALSWIAVPAKAEGLRPCDLTPAWFDKLQRRATGMTLKRVRTGCLLLDSLREDHRIRLDLLPAEPSGVVRRPRKEKGDALVPDPPREAPEIVAWRALFAAARRAGLSEVQLNPLSAVRAQATREGLPPTAIDTAWMEARRAGRPQRVRARFAMSARLLDQLRRHPELARHLPARPIGPLADRRRSAACLPPAMESELAATLAAQGAAPSTRREAAIALRALADCAAIAGIRPPHALDELLALDPDTIDWGAHRDRANARAEVITRLRRFRTLPWSSAWRSLQAAIVTSDVRPADNPVPALLSVAQGRDPQMLDHAWAHAVERGYRAAGRADLARTLVANLRRLDALHGLPPVAGTGLLPARFCASPKSPCSVPIR